MSLNQPQIHKFLSSILPFKELSKEDLLKLSSVAKEYQYEKGSTIFNEGDPADSVWVIYDGRIQIMKYTTQAKPFAIESLGRGELFGTLCRLGGDGKIYPCTSVTAKSTTVLRILDRTFLEYYVKSSGIARGVCTLCSQRLKDVQDLRCVGQEHVSVRVGNTLSRLYDVHGEVIPFTKKEVAELSGTTVETTFRILHALQKKKILSSSRGKIKIQKPAELKELSETC